jgi:hypothetical protein
MRICVLIVVAGHIFALASQSALAVEQIKTCSYGWITLDSFKDHVAELRKSGRYTAADIDELINKERQGGPHFFSSQIVIKQEQSASGDFDLNLFQGFSDPLAKYRRLQAWACTADNYPIAYFVGFRVRAIRHGAIFVSRENGTVNVISLKHSDPDLDKQTSVKDFRSGAVLCQDIGTGCVNTIFYGRW